MERELIGILGLGILFILLFLQMPVAQAMVLVGIGGNFFLSLVVSHLQFIPYLKQFKTLLWGIAANYDLSVIPLFILMGFLASYGNLSQDLFRGINLLLGKFRSGVAIAAILACAGFGAVCGSSLATAGTMGKVALPELKRLNYKKSFATGTLAAGGTLGILIPPSLVLVIYAIIVEASIVKMFQAAIIPGIMAVLFFSLVIIGWIKLKPEIAPERKKNFLQNKKKILLKLIPVLVIFGIIILGLGFGFFTPTPSAAIGALVVLIYGVFLYWKNKSEGLSWKKIQFAFLDTAKTTGMIYFILFGAEVLKGFFARANLPNIMASWATTSDTHPWLILVFMLFILIVLGCFMDSLAIILVVVPFFWPALLDLNAGEMQSFGMDDDALKIWFGILALVVVELGLITPPVGLNVFIISSLAKDTSMKETFFGVMPFFSIEMVRVLLLLLFPILSLFLPQFLSG